MLPTRETFIVNESLQALPLDRRVFTDLRLRDQWAKRVPSVPDDQELPVSGNGTLEAGTLYPSSTDPSVRYYLPGYALATARGNYLTSLKWRTADQGPRGTDGPLGWRSSASPPWATARGGTSWPSRAR